jgi:hypothetical protein
MLIYPQLQAGNMAQFPLKKHLTMRTVQNRLLDGSRIVQRSLLAATTEWELLYSGLSDEERTKIEALHTATEGRLRTFTFLDPAGNLLRWSEDLSNTVWTKDAGLTVTGGISSPQGSARASLVANATPIAQNIKQTIAAPGNFTYAFRLQVKAAQDTQFVLFLECGSARQTKQVTAKSEWTTVWISGNLQETGENTAFGFEIPANQAIEVFGIGVTPQPGPGEYVRTRSTSGVYQNVRFANDQLSITTHGPNDTAMTVRLTTTG